MEKARDCPEANEPIPSFEGLGLGILNEAGRILGVNLDVALLEEKLGQYMNFYLA